MSSCPRRCLASCASFLSRILWGTVLIAALVGTAHAASPRALECVLSERLLAHRGGAEAASAVFAPKVRPAVHVQRRQQPIAIDGVLDDAGWCDATHITGFTEVQPGDQTPPPVRTEVLVTYDANHLYLAFLAHDDDPAAIRASLRNRDEIFADDWVGIILDAYGDAAQAYEIFANPLGIQGDLLMAAGSGEDVGYDLVYQSEGQITAAGYQVEMAIPFSSLRFPNRPEQRWRATFIRTRPRASREQYSWSSVDRDDPCFMCQFGTLAGIENVTPSTTLDILPAVVGAQSGALADPDAPAAGFETGRVRIEPSLTLRYNVTPSLAAEATVNPDFSQVESDAAQIDVNSTFALFFPERRPFFQEGSDLFETYLDIVYTRSINNPLVATKLTGRAGRTSVAYLGAMDEDTPLLLPFAERSAIAEAGRSFSNVLRARRTFGESSYLGATLTDRRLFDGGYGSLGSLDARWQLFTNYRLEAQLALSTTREPAGLPVDDDTDAATFDAGAHTAALDGERFGGRGLFVSVDRNARHWNVDLAYQELSPTFRTANGFVTGNDVRRLRMWQGVMFYPETAWVERVQPGLFVRTDYAFQGAHREDVAEVMLWSRLRGQTQVFMSYGVGRERFRGVRFEGLSDWTVRVNSRFSDVVTGGFYVSGGRSIFRDDEPERGRRRAVSMWATLKPLQRFVIQPEVDYSALHDLDTNETFFRGYIVRTRVSMQFTRELSLRLVTQYNDFDTALDLEPLLQYQVNPFTVFYVGSTHGVSRYDPPHGWLQAERQFFFKVQYLFRV